MTGRDCVMSLALAGVVCVGCTRSVKESPDSSPEDSSSTLLDAELRVRQLEYALHMNLVEQALTDSDYFAAKEEPDGGDLLTCGTRPDASGV